jgi:hypothetical protein
MNDLRSARYVRDYVVHLEFDDGLEGDVDLSLDLGRRTNFSLLWPNCHTSSSLPRKNGTLAGPNGADIATERLAGRFNHALLLLGTLLILFLRVNAKPPSQSIR